VISLPPYETDRVKYLSEVSEEYKIGHVEMVSVINWKNTIEGFLTLKNIAEPLIDGEMKINVDKKCYNIKVTDGIPSVTESECEVNGVLTLSHNEAENLFFSPMGLVRKSEKTKNWAPLPFFINASDAF
jgi:hypothetical protein